MPRLRRVSKTPHPIVQIYTFCLPAKEISKLCRVERFGVDENGVQRRYDENHATKIAIAMIDPKTLWLEAIIGGLVGNWRFKDGELLYDDEDYITVDDGQHRVLALQSGLISAAEIAHLNLNFTVTLGLSYEDRLRIFQMQMKRKTIDPRLLLAQNQRLGQWKHEVDQDAYSIVLRLNTDPHSPIKGQVQIYETAHRPKEDGGDLEYNKGISSRGLFASIRTVIGSKSPLASHTLERKGEIVMTTIRLAAEVWSKKWGSGNHVLSTARGVNAVLRLLMSGRNFASVVGNDYSEDKIREALNLAANFDWSRSKSLNASQIEMMERLDQSIGRGIQKRTVAQPATE